MVGGQVSGCGDAQGGCPQGPKAAPRRRWGSGSGAHARGTHTRTLVGACRDCWHRCTQEGRAHRSARVRSQGRDLDEAGLSVAALSPGHFLALAIVLQFTRDSPSGTQDSVHSHGSVITARCVCQGSAREAEPVRDRCVCERQTDRQTDMGREPVRARRSSLQGTSL